MKPGDRVAYTNEFIYDMGGWGSTMKARRGVFVGPSTKPGFVVVLWSDSTDGEGTDVESENLSLAVD